MAGKPTDLGRWATVSGTQIVVPVEGKKDTGFGPDEEPAAQAFNWKWNNDYNWKDWLNGVVAPGSGDKAFVYIDTDGALSASNADITFPSTHYHPTRIHSIHAASGMGLTAAGAIVPMQVSGGLPLGRWRATAADNTFIFPITGLTVGDFISKIEIYQDSTSATTKNYYFRGIAVDATVTTFESTTYSTYDGGPGSTVEITVSPEIDITDDMFYYVVITLSDSADTIMGCNVLYSRHA